MEYLNFKNLLRKFIATHGIQTGVPQLQPPIGNPTKWEYPLCEPTVQLIGGV